MEQHIRMVCDKNLCYVCQSELHQTEIIADCICQTCQDLTEPYLAQFEEKPKDDLVHHPNHYTWIPGIECKDVAKHFNFHTGNAIKYLWRADYKGTPIQDLEKAIENIQSEIERRKDNA